MTKGTGDLVAVWTLLSVSTLGFLACSAPQVAPAPDVQLPVTEHRMFVDMPTNTNRSADDLRAQYRSARRTISHIRQRCVSDPSTVPCTVTTDVRISAVEGARYVNPDDAPNHPQIIAWIENLGDRVTYDGIEPMTIAVYALVVDSLPKANPRILRVRFPAARATGRRDIQTVAGGNVYPCHNYGQPYISDADFQPCSPYRMPTLTALHSRSAQATFASASIAVALSGSDPTWFSCSSGCCSASAHRAFAVRDVPAPSPYFSFDHSLALGRSVSH